MTQRILDTAREPSHDIRGQIAALLDPNSAKDAVFLAPWNRLDRPWGLPSHVIEVTGECGILLTTDAAKAEAFKTAWDDDMAVILGYPQSKSDVVRRGMGALVVQVRDWLDRCVTECAVSPDMVNQAIEQLKNHVVNPTIALMTLTDALERRVYLLGGV